MSGLCRDGFRLRLYPAGGRNGRAGHGGILLHHPLGRGSGSGGGTDTEFSLTTPAQLAGVAELVNSNTTDFAGKTIRLGADISLLRYEEPGKPGEPSRPTQPEKPTTPDTPATGDSSNVTALWVVLAVAGVGIIVLVVLLVTKRKNKKD